MKIFILVLLIVGDALGQASPPQKSKAGWHVYRSPDYGFEVSYPPDFTFYPARPDYKETQLSYIPVCAMTTVACFEYNGKEYEGTTFQAAGVSVNVLRDRRTEGECKEIDTGRFPVKQASFNGLHFHYGETGSVALSHSIGGPAYRLFHEHICFEIAAGTTATSIGAYDPGTIKEFNSKKLSSELNSILHTFRFVAPSLDGPDWQVHHGSGCGGSFEYPDGDTVVAAIAYSNERYFSKNITCEDYFIHGGLKYTVAAKANLATGVELQEWLKASALPDLSKATLVSQGKYFTAYRAEPYHYIFGQGAVFVLSVADPKGRVFLPRDDRVLNHLLDNFKVD